MKDQQKYAPPKAVMTFNIGVVGHRDLPQADLPCLKVKIDEILDTALHAVEEAFNRADGLYIVDSRPQFQMRILSSLAEGADRIVAQRALLKGYTLQCPLPFEEKIYENDFAGNESKTEFRELLSRAESVFEIACNGHLKSRSYRAAGDVMLQHSDLVIAIWDEQESDKPGSTADIIERALENEIPIVCIHAASPHAAHFLYAGKKDSSWMQQVSEKIAGILTPFGADSDTANRLYAEAYFNEKQQAWNFAAVYSIFKKLFSAGTCTMKLWKRVPAFHEAEANRWADMKKVCPSAPQKIIVHINNYLKIHYAWADNLALFYADYFRSAGLLKQFIIIAASFGLATGFYWNWCVTKTWVNIFGFFMQAVFLGIVILISRMNEKKHWQQKFVDYRILAELTRQMRYLSPLGLTVRGLRVPAYNKFEKVTWINWCFRAVTRQAGLPGIKMDANALEACRTMLLEDNIKGQMEYFRKDAERSNKIAKRIAKVGMILFWTGFIVTSIRVIAAGVLLLFPSGPLNGMLLKVLFYIGIPPVAVPFDKVSTTLFNTLSLLLPACAAGILGIEAQTGFKRLADRYTGMYLQLDTVYQHVHATTDITYDKLKQFAEKTADILIAEVSDWRVFLASKSIRRN